MCIRSFSPCRKFTVPIVLVLLSELLLGCSPPATPQVPDTPLPTAPPTETPLPPPTAVPSPTVTPFVPKATVKIAVHVPLSGDNAPAGTDIQRAVQMAVEDLSGPLNALGYKVDVTSYDDQSDVKTAVANIKEIIADPQILCGVGNYYSSITMQTSELYHPAHLAFISPSNTGANVTERGYLEVNRVVGRDDVEGIAAARFAKSQGFSAVYIIQTNWEPLKKSGENFKREADRLGLKVVGILSTDVTEDFSGVIKRVLSSGSDFIYFASTVNQAGPFFRQAREAGFTGGFMVIDSNPALADLAGPRLAEGKGAYYIDTAVPVTAFAGASAFAAQFEDLYGAAPHTFAAQAYDAAGICMKAIEEASKALAGDLPTREQVARTIRSLVDYPGITGTYSFNERGDPALVNYFVYKITSIDAAGWAQNAVIATFDVPPPK